MFRLKNFKRFLRQRVLPFHFRFRPDLFLHTRGSPRSLSLHPLSATYALEKKRRFWPGLPVVNIALGRRVEILIAAGEILPQMFRQGRFGERRFAAGGNESAVGDAIGEDGGLNGVRR
jgi:hypothetical protein